VRVEAQFLGLVAALRAITDGRDLLFDTSMAFPCGTDGPDMAMFSRACGGGRRHRLGG
jgi:hypothetical protein